MVWKDKVVVVVPFDGDQFALGVPFGDFNADMEAGKFAEIAEEFKARLMLGEPAVLPPGVVIVKL